MNGHNLHTVLMLIGGSYHDFEGFAATASSFIEATGRFQVEVTHDRERLRRLDPFDALVLYTQGGELTRAQEGGLCDYVRSGGGLLAVHGAAASWHDNDGYMELLGCRFVGHGQPGPIDVTLTEAGAAVLPRARENFTIFDECYMLESTSDAPRDVLWTGTWEFEEQPLGHVRRYGEGTVLYTALGHDPRAWEHPDFQDLIIRSLLHITGEEDREPVRWGLVGYGPAYNMGRFHGRRVMETAGLQLAAVCDRDPQRLEAAQVELGELPVFTDAAEMAASGLVDGAVLSLPHNIHARVGVPLLEAGLHVIMEKPFAITVEECDRLMAAAGENQVMLTVHHNRHWDPDVVTLRRLVEEGAIGELFSITVNMVGYRRPKQIWRSSKEVSGGLLYDWGAHQFEKIFQLVPKERDGKAVNRSAVAFGNFLKKVWHDTTNEDHGRAYLKFDSGLEAEMIQSQICTAPMPRWRILGTRGSIEIPHDDGDAAVVRSVSPDHSGQLEVRRVPLKGGSSRDFYRNVADHLHAGLPLVIPASWARNPIAAIRACEEAAAQNRVLPVTFELDLGQRPKNVLASDP